MASAPVQSKCRMARTGSADTSVTPRRPMQRMSGDLPERAARMSYVISPEGKIVYEYTAMDPDEHVSKTLQAVRDLAAQQGTK